MLLESRFYVKNPAALSAYKLVAFAPVLMFLPITSLRETLSTNGTLVGIRACVFGDMML